MIYKVAIRVLTYTQTGLIGFHQIQVNSVLMAKLLNVVKSRGEFLRQ